MQARALGIDSPTPLLPLLGKRVQPSATRVSVRLQSANFGYRQAGAAIHRQCRPAVRGVTRDGPTDREDSVFLRPSSRLTNTTRR